MRALLGVFMCCLIGWLLIVFEYSRFSLVESLMLARHRSCCGWVASCLVFPVCSWFRCTYGFPPCSLPFLPLIPAKLLLICMSSFLSFYHSVAVSHLFFQLTHSAFSHSIMEAATVITTLIISVDPLEFWEKNVVLILVRCLSNILLLLSIN